MQIDLVKASGIRSNISYGCRLLYSFNEGYGKTVTMEDIIRTVNFTKQYGNKVTVDRVSISVKKGEIYGFLA
ncbi:hypothetical protein D3C76_1835360 [compost metagenome]